MTLLEEIQAKIQSKKDAIEERKAEKANQSTDKSKEKRIKATAP